MQRQRMQQEPLELALEREARSLIRAITQTRMLGVLAGVAGDASHIFERSLASLASIAFRIDGVQHPLIYVHPQLDDRERRRALRELA